jgi:hypothetical protein
MTSQNDLAIRRAFEAAGVEFIDENDGGPGVRLRKGQEHNSVDKQWWNVTIDFYWYLREGTSAELGEPVVDDRSKGLSSARFAARKCLRSRD